MGNNLALLETDCFKLPSKLGSFSRLTKQRLTKGLAVLITLIITDLVCTNNIRQFFGISKRLVVKALVVKLTRFTQMLTF